jgi:NADH-quinone oxidoreductase subunit C
MIDETDKPQSDDSAERATEESAAPTADETPEQKRARMLAEVKAKAAAKMAAKGGATDAKPDTPAATPPPPATPTAATTDAPSGETPEEKRARIIAEAKAKATAKMAAKSDAGATGGETATAGAKPTSGATTPATSDEEKAARIAEARAKAAALKPAAGASGAAATGEAGAPKAPVKKKEEGAKPSDASEHPLVKRLKENLDGAVSEATEFLGQLSVRIVPSRIVEVCEFLKRDAGSPFDYLSDLTCVHFPENADAPFEVVYNLYSISANERVRLKVATTDAAGVESVTGVWPAANWMEREVYDLFGVRFHHHPDLRRLLLPPDWEGHPLRKDYPLEPVENNWTAKHLPEFSEVQREQLEQRRAYGLEALSTPDERRIREIFIAGKEVMPLDRK